MRWRFAQPENSHTLWYWHLAVNRPSSRRQRRLCRLPLPGLLAGWLAWNWLILPLSFAAAAEPVGPRVTPRVQELKPELYYLEDDAGGLVPVPGFRYRDFVDLIRLREGLPGLPELPGAVLEQLRVRVTMPDEADSRQTAEVQVEGVVRQTRSGWVMLPLKLPELVLSGAPEVTGEGRVILTIDKEPADAAGGEPFADAPLEGGPGVLRSKSGGFLVWLNGRETGAASLDADAERQTIVLRGLLPVDANESRDILSLTLPAAATSQLEIATWRRNPQVSLEPRVLAPVVKPLADEAAGGATSLVSVEGLVGPTRIRLAKPELSATATVELTEVKTESVVRVDGRTARFDAVLRLSNLPPDRRTLAVSLPPRSTLLRVDPPASLVRRAGTADEPQVLIRLDDVGDGKAVVELACERAIDASGRTGFDAGGFAVAGIPAWRQWGSTSVIAEGDWQVDWEPRPGNRRVDPPVALQEAGFVAAFAYDSQPARLPLTVRPRSSRVVIEPEYRYHVSGSRIQLDARLRASIRGVAAERVRLAIPGWEIEEVGPAGIVDTARLTTDGNEVSVPFLQPLAGDVVVELRCSRPIDRVNTLLRWTTPVPRADLVGPASVTISSDSDIELVPDNELIEGMSRQVAIQQGRAAGELPRMAYRVEATEAIFAATRRFLDRQVDAAITAQIDIGTAALAVRQAVRLDVANVPLEFVGWLVPESILAEAEIEIRQNGQLLQPEIVAADIEAASPPTQPPAAAETASEDRQPAAEQPRRVARVLLAEPLLGTGELVVRYRQPLPEIPDETTVAVSVPLLLPRQAVIGRETVTLTDAAGFNIDVRDDRWNREGDLQQLGFGRTWNAVQAQPQLDLAISKRSEDVRGETIVEAGWVRTTLRRNLRVDRWTYAVTTAANRLPLFLPVTAEAESAMAADPVTARLRVDGGDWQAAGDSSGRLMVDLGQSEGTHLLEIEVRRPLDDNLLGGLLPLPQEVRLERPGLPASTLYRRVYWELLPPAEAVVLAGPAGWTDQQSWSWRRLGFQPTPLVSADDLAAWVAAAVAQSASQSDRSLPRPGDAAAESAGPRLLPPAAAVAARLVYCDVGMPAAVGVVMVPRWLLVLAASGLALLVGLTAAVRRQLVGRLLLPLAVAFVGGMAAAPVATLLIVQAAAPGLVLATLAGGYGWWQTAGPVPASLAAEPASWQSRRPDSVTRAAPGESLVINLKTPPARPAQQAGPSRSIAES